MRFGILPLLFVVGGCAGRADGDWRFVYRIEVPHEQGCTVVGSKDRAAVRLEGPSCDGERAGWCHPCQDGTPGLCPDVSAPGMYVDVYSHGDADPADYVFVEACR